MDAQAWAGWIIIFFVALVVLFLGGIAYILLTRVF